jgi:outer membrane PBP1 activator LpoA protein
MRFYRIVMIVLIGFVLSACSFKSPSDKESANNQHQMGNQLDARFYPLGGKVLQKIAHHTYPEAFDDNAERYAWKALGAIAEETYSLTR